MTWNFQNLDLCGVHWGVEIVDYESIWKLKKALTQAQINLTKFAYNMILCLILFWMCNFETWHTLKKNTYYKNQFSLFTYFMATEEVWHFDGSFVKDGEHNVSK